MRCHTCGAEVVEKAIYCHKCGERLQSGDERSSSAGEETGQRAPDAPASQAAAAASPAAIGPAEKGRPTLTAHLGAEDEPEKELWQGGYSSRAMIGGWLLTSLLTIALLILAIGWKFGKTNWIVVLVIWCSWREGRLVLLPLPPGL